MLLLGVDGLCTGGVTQTATQTVWGAGGGIGVERFGKQPLPKINSTKRGGKHSLTFQPNLRVQEAPGSNPGTPTIGPRVSLGIRGLSLAFHHFFDELNFWRFDLNQTRPKREKFQGVPGRLARYSLMIFVFFRVTVRLSEP